MLLCFFLGRGVVVVVGVGGSEDSSLRFLEFAVEFLLELENVVSVVCFFFLWEEDDGSGEEEDLVFFFCFFLERGRI